MTPSQHIRLMSAVRDVIAERHRQYAKWGEQDLARKQLNPFAFSLLWEESQRQQQKEGLHTWDNVLVEELIEALDEKDPAKVRAELVQVAAVAVQWIEAIDRQESAAEKCECPAEGHAARCPIDRIGRLA